MKTDVKLKRERRKRLRTKTKNEKIGLLKHDNMPEMRPDETATSTRHWNQEACRNSRRGYTVQREIEREREKFIRQVNK